ncbi:NAD-dependent epimerase/dehydratase family protein [Streptomyces spiralis]|uniref:NAD-dependent epimerase/dehydratase family protein n=1 Tax=Streptomyces spiralis TaxID=66376 RepID=UPI0036885EBB
MCGGSGFIGRAVVGELVERGGLEVRVLARRAGGAAGWAGGGVVRGVCADLTRPASLRGLCSGVGAVVHAASYVGRDPVRCEVVNHAGTVALLAEARRAGVGRFVYVSTASVYGGGPHRGVGEGVVVPRPVSAASASRLRAERAVLEAGGCVLRPHLVYGAGDEWFVPAVARVVARVPVWPSGPVSVSSVIAVGDLARGVAGLVGAPGDVDCSGVYHAVHPRPVPMDEVLLALHQCLGVPLPRVGEVSVREHRALVARAVPELSDHQYALLTRDHWYRGDRLWACAGVDPGPGFAARFAGAAGWYAGRLGGDARPGVPGAR